MQHPYDGLAGLPPELDASYQVLSELTRSRSTATYLARERATGREVEIRVLRPAGPNGRQVLAHAASDARLLSGQRHPNVRPIVGVQWLTDDALAIVSERTRGTPLHEVVAGAGPLPLPRAMAVLRDVAEALSWAQSVGVVHRTLQLDDVTLESGAGRVVVAFDMAAASDRASWMHGDPHGADALAARRADVHQMGLLAWHMLTGQPTSHPGSRLTDLRPDLSPAVGEVIDGALSRDPSRCCPDALRFAAELYAAAGPQGGHAVPATGSRGAWVPSVQPPAPSAPPPAWSAPAPAPQPWTQQPYAQAQPAGDPVGPGAWAPPPPTPSHGRGRLVAGLLVAAVLVAAVLVAAALFAFRGRGDDDRSRSRDSQVATTDAREEAAGEVLLDSASIDSTLRASEDVGAYVPSRASESASTGSASPTASPTASPRGSRPRASTTPSTAPRTTSPAARGALARCSSPTTTDQRACVLGHLAVSDTGLNRAYASVIRQLMQSGDGAQRVQRLRAEQRAWLVQRDEACRGVGDGPLWGTARARCLAERSAERTRELEGMR